MRNPPLPSIHRILLAGLCSSLLLSCQGVDNLLIGVSGKPQASAVPTPAPSAPLTTSAALSFPADHAVPFTAKGSKTYLQRWNGSAYENFYIKGVNLGIGLPGTQAGDLAASRAQFRSWFARMGEAGVNSLRVYTLHFPAFYEELATYNEAHPEHPIYLFQGGWIDEDLKVTELYQATAGFDQNIREVVDAVHGNLTVAERQGKAYGTYRTDLSRWVAGWLIGREIAPAEILETNRLHPDKTSYKGQHINLPQGNPSEVWMAEHIDKLIEYERSKYKMDRPISVSSWPTLDPIKHPTENPLETQEDVASIDLAQLDLFDAPGGYFASFHAYPYYPDFMNDDPGYRQERDAQGVNNYVGYLKQLKAHYHDIPLVIAEYGVPSSWGDAHFSPSGMDHGGHDEVSQGHDDARLTQNLYDNGLAGGMLFAWIDEWWKRTWIVDEISYPRERYRLWNNLTSPEENFGLIAFDTAEPAYKTLQQSEQGAIRRIEAAYDAKYFHVRLQLGAAYRPGTRLTIGFDTYRDDLGDPVLPDGARTGYRHEFALDLNLPANAQLYVTQPYDLLGIWHGAAGPEQSFQSKAVENAPWDPVRWQNNQYHTSVDGALSFPITYYDIGKLRIRKTGDAATSMDAVVVDDRTIDVRLPWSLLQFSDPSTRSVIHDDRSTPGRESLVSEGIGVSVSYAGQVVDSQGRFVWPTWNVAPPVTEREKPAMNAMQQAWHSLPDKP